MSTPPFVGCSRAARLRVPGLLAALLLLVAGTALGQDPKAGDPKAQGATTQDPKPAAGDPPTSTDPKPVVEDATPVSGPSDAELVAWSALVDAAVNLTEEVRKGLKEAYAAAQVHVANEAKSRERTASLDAKREGAPDNLKTVVAELAKPVVDARPDPDAEDSPHREETLAQWEQHANQARADKETADKELAALEEEKRLRGEDRVANPEATQKAQTRLAELERELTGTPASVDPLDPAFAKRQRLLAERAYLRQRLLELKAEILSYDARTELMARRLDLAARKRKEKTEVSDHWAGLVAARKTREAAADAERAREEARLAETLRIPKLTDVAKTNVDLTERRTQLDAFHKQAVEDAKQVDLELDELRKRFDQDKKWVEQAGFALGQYLHSSRRQVLASASLDEHRTAIRRREDVLNDVILEQIRLENQAQNLGDIEARIAEVLDESELSPLSRAMVESSLANAYRNLADNLSKNLDAYGEYTAALRDLDFKENELVSLSDEYLEYLNEHVLWVRSSFPIGRESIFGDGGVLEAIDWLISPWRWRQVIDATTGDVLSVRVGNYLVLVLALVLLRVARRKIGVRRKGEDVAEAQDPKSPLTPVIRLTLDAMVRAAGVPIIVAFVGWRIRSASEGRTIEPFANGVAAGVMAVAMLLFSLGILRELSRKGGLAERHFGWPTSSLRTLRLSLRGFAGFGGPLLFAYACFGLQRQSDYADSMGRVAFLALVVLGAVFSWRLKRPFEGVISSFRGGAEWLGLWSFLFTLTGFWMPLLLAGLAAYGYFFTATQLANSLLGTGWLFMMLLFAFAVVDQWFQYHRRLLALERLRRRREELAAEVSGDVDERNEALAAVPSEPDEVDLRRANEQTRGLLRNVALVLFVFGMWAIWSDVLPALGILDEVELWKVGAGNVDEQSITVVSALRCIAYLAITAIVGVNVTGFLDLVVLKRLPLEPGSRYAVVTLVRYGIGLVGIVLAFSAIGLKWSQLQWLAAALTVGLGFGLQEIFANFVSGLILLFERPVRVGDTVTISGTSGVVTRIRMRATTIADWDRKELVIPNKTFITGELVNWSLTDTVTRLVFPIGVAYGSDLKLVENLLLRAARDHRDVLSDPAPNVVFQGFGDSALNFDLRLFVPSVERIVPVRHDVNRAIDAMFRKNNVTIPFPQRDVHLRIESGGDGTVTVRPEPRAGA